MGKKNKSKSPKKEKKKKNKKRNNSQDSKEEFTKVNVHKDGLDNEVNVVLVGDEAIGKSSIINCYTHDLFNPDYTPSIFD